ncbi:MAG: pilin [Candidatus Falkowbacteria bacterium]
MKIAKRLFVFLFVASIALTSALSVSAANVTGWDENAAPAANVEAQLGLGNSPPQVMAAKVINWALGFLGIIAVVIILMGGFKWMTAGGNEDKVGEAKKLMAAGLIGLIIILAAWGVATYVVSSLLTSTGASTS